MKLTNLVIGFIIFSIVTTLFFWVTYEMLREQGVEGATDFQGLSGEYGEYASQFDEEDSAMRDMIKQTESGKASSEEKDVNILTGIVAGGLTALNFLGNFENIVHNATGDVEQHYVDDRLTGVIIAIIVIVIGFTLLHFLRAAKTET